MLFEALLVAASTSGMAELKCPRTDHQFPGAPENSPVYIIDGSVHVGREEVQKIAPSGDEVAKVEVSCWNPDTDGFDPRRGGIPLILIVSTEAQAEAEARAERMAQRLRDHAETNGGLPLSLRQLGDASGDFAVTVLEDGWRVSATDDTPLRCTVTQPGDDAEATVKCMINYDAVGAELRAIYEGGSRAG